MHQWRMGAVRSKYTCCKRTTGRVRTVPKLKMWSVLLHVSGVGSGCGILHKHTQTYAQKERERKRARDKRDVWVYACLSTELQQSFTVYSAWQARQESVQSPDVQNRKTRPNKYVHSLVDTRRSAGVGALLKRSHGSAWQRTLPRRQIVPHGRRSWSGTSTRVQGHHRPE